MPWNPERKRIRRPGHHAVLIVSVMTMAVPSIQYGFSFAPRQRRGYHKRYVVSNVEASRASSSNNNKDNFDVLNGEHGASDSVDSVWNSTYVFRSNDRVNSGDDGIIDASAEPSAAALPSSAPSSTSRILLGTVVGAKETAAAAAARAASVPLSTLPTRKMNLMWCQSDRCVDVVRERVIGEHNSIVYNGPATGQVAYRWNRKAASIPPVEGDRRGDGSNPRPATVSSILLLVRAGDEALLRIAAENVPKLTEVGIQVLLAPDLAAKLKHYYGVDDPRISLFETPKDPNQEKWKIRHVDDDDDEWFSDMMYREPFPDLVCTLGGDGLLMHASMLFQGPVPPMLAISGGSLGFLTAFGQNEMVDAVKIALGMVAGSSKGSDLAAQDALTTTTSNGMEQEDSLQVFPPNMPSYPYEPLMKPPHVNDATPKFSFGLGDYICMTIRMRLDCRVVNREGVVRARYNVLNEVVIDRGSSPYLAALECFCDDVHLTTVQADGVIFAT